MNMQRAIRMCLTVAAVMMFSGCGMDHYENVPAKIERVVVERPYAFFNREEGVKIPGQAFNVGQRNHGNGPCLAYDFDTTIQNKEIEMEVKVADNINVPFVLGSAWRIIPGKAVDAALNYMPEFVNSDGTSFKPSEGNEVQVIKVPVQAIFARNVIPYFDEVGRDIIDSYRSKDIRRDELAQKIQQELIKRLQKHKIPKAKITAKGIEYGKMIYKDGKYIYNGPMIAITDVIDIQRISVRYENPDFINTKIEDIEKLKADVLTKKAELAQWVQRKKTRIQQATNARKTALNIKKSLEKNPMMKKYQRLDNLRNLISNAKPGINTKVYLMPREMIQGGRYAYGNTGNRIAKPSAPTASKAK